MTALNICDLPNVILGAILSRWIETPDLCRLDSALCNHSLRPAFLECLSHPSFATLGTLIGRETNNNILLWALQRRTQLLQLNVDDPDLNISAEDLYCFRRLIQLEIFYRNRTRPILQSAAGTLRMLRLRGCDVNFPSAFDLIFSCKQLLSLEIDDQRKISKHRKGQRTVTSAPAEHCSCPFHNTCKQSLSHCFSVTMDPSAPAAAVDSATSAGVLLPSLTQVKISWTAMCEMDMWRLLDAAPSVSYIELTNVDFVKSSFVKQLVTSRPMLRAVKFIRCKFLTSDGISHLSRCRRLQWLDLNGSCGISDAALRTVLMRCGRALRHLNLRNGLYLTNQTMECIAHYCKQLRYLDIGFCTQIDDAGLTAIADNCLLLEHLNVPGCALLSDDSIRLFAKPHRSRMQAINVWNCPFITKRTNSAFQAIGVNPERRKLY